jgi:hypothetical protein
VDENDKSRGDRAILRRKPNGSATNFKVLDFQTASVRILRTHTPHVFRHQFRLLAQQTAPKIQKRLRHKKRPHNISQSTPRRPNFSSGPMSKAELYLYYERMGMLEVFFALFPGG